MLSVSLNYTALMGVVGIAIWLMMYLLFFSAHREVAMQAGIIVGTIVIFYLLLIIQERSIMHLVPKIWSFYRSAPLFGAENISKFWFYHQWLTVYYPSLWYFTILFAAAGVWKYPAPCTLSISIFSTTFISASFAGPKGFRYIAFAMPFLFVIWCMGLSIIVPSIIKQIKKLKVQHQNSSLQLFTVNTLLVIGAAFFFVGNPAWIRMGAMLADRPLPGEVPPERWSLASERLREFAAHVEVIVATNELAALYYLRKADVTLSKSKLLEVDQGGREFTVDGRTGLPVISTGDSLMEIIRCKGSGLIIVTPTFIENDRDGGKIRGIMEKNLTKIELNEETGLVALYWQRQAIGSALCAPALRATDPASRQSD